MKRWIQEAARAAALGLATLAAGPAPAAAAQEDAPAARAQDQALGWSFASPWETEEEAAQAVAERRAWLADLRVKLLAGRQDEVEGWPGRLEAIAFEAASNRPLPDQAALLAEIALTRAEGLAAAGKIDEARRALDRLLPGPGHPSASRLEPASETLLAAAREAAGDPRLARRRAELAPASSAPAQADQGLDEALREAIARKEFNLAVELGARAAGALEDAVLADLDAFPASAAADPFSWLARVDEARAAELALAHLERSGYAFQRRVLRAIALHSLFSTHASHHNWANSVGSGPRRYLRGPWLSVLAGILLGPRDAAREALDAVGEVYSADGVTPELADALIAAMRRDATLQSRLLAMVAAGGDPKRSMRPVLEGMLASEDVEVRRGAALYLRGILPSAALLERATDPDAKVRRIAAEAFVKRRNDPPLDADERGRLLRLLRDDDEHVRATAVPALESLDAPFEAEVYRALAQDPSVEVRYELGELESLPEPIGSDVMGTLARDPNPVVVELVDERLARSTNNRLGPALLAAARVRLPHYEDSQVPRSSIISSLVREDAALRVLLEAALEDPSGALLREALDQTGNFSSATGTGISAVLTLDDAAIARLFAMTALHDVQSLGWISDAIRNAPTPRWDAALAVLLDRKAPAVARLAAAAAAVEGGGEAWRAGVLDLFGTPPLSERDLAEGEKRYVNTLMQGVALSDANALALAALRAERLRESVRVKLAAGYRPEGEDGEAITRLVLERWLERADGLAEQPMRTALFHLRTLAVEGRDEMLRTALRNGWYAEHALQTMASLEHADSFLPSFEAALRAEWVHEDGQRYSMQRKASAILTGLPGDGATDALLTALATSPDAFVRDNCRNALEQRRKTLELRREWDEARAGALDRASATRDLLALLADDDAAVRAQAAVGLATLEAVEALPALIALLKDPDPKVKDAARAALERLNAPK